MPARRPRNAEVTRSDLLRSARARFAAEGYEATTLRAVAADAGVDPALAVRHFGSKEGLFAAAAELDLEMPDLAGVAPERLGEALLGHFFTVWEDQDTFRALLRASASHPGAREAMRRLFAEQVAPALRRAAPHVTDAQAALVGAFVLGLAYSRTVIATEPLARLTRDELVSGAAPALTLLLAGESAG